MKGKFMNNLLESASFKPETGVSSPSLVNLHGKES
jgi:hypothetical protein